MKYRRKPVSRDVVDAIFDKTQDCYIVDRDGVLASIPRASFEADYEPVVREHKAKKKSKREKLLPPLDSSM